MPLVELTDPASRGAQVMTVCNACRYCEQFCPVFPAMERRLTFERADLAYLANLCHNCGECLYACQYAPPHEFGINVPSTLANLRIKSYEVYCWPRALGRAFSRQGLSTAFALVTLFSVVLLVFVGQSTLARDASADFYAVVPHGVMVALFGGVFAFALLAITIGMNRFWRDASASLPDGNRRAGPVGPAVWIAALRDAATLRHLQAASVDCASSEETRTPWRRVFHHCTFYGFALCFASTVVAAIYHSVFGWVAPYGYTSAPVVLGTIGGAGLFVGAAGLFVLRRTRDTALGGVVDPGLDDSFIALLFLTSATGLALLVLRHTPSMGILLVVHLGSVLALFVTLPYGKFVHGLYRVAALAIDARERDRPSR